MKLLEKLTPKGVFLLDGIGALLSCFLLIILVRFESIFGMPSHALYALALFPLAFLVYDIICYLTVKRRSALLIKIIAISNFVYCGISLVFVIDHLDSLTAIGLTYFILEMIVIFVLALAELEYAGYTTQNN